MPSNVKAGPTKIKRWLCHIKRRHDRPLAADCAVPPVTRRETPMREVQLVADINFAINRQVIERRGFNDATSS